MICDDVITKKGRHFSNMNVFELHIQKVICIQKLNFVLSFKLKKIIFSAKTAKKQNMIAPLLF